MNTVVTFLPAMPLRSYHAALPADGRIDYDTLEQLAREGKLTGAYKQGRNWWINLLAHAQMGIPTENANDEEETKTSTREGNGMRDPARQTALRQNSRKGREGPPKRTLRHPGRSGKAA